MTEETRILRGECDCRAVSFTVQDAFEYALYCHCGRPETRDSPEFLGAIPAAQP
jgi:hypothetical protein